MKIFLPSPHLLPSGFRYPREYLQLVEKSDLPDLFPWHFLGETPDELEPYVTGMLSVHADKHLIPFARFEDSADGDLACFDGSDKNGDPKIYFHVFGRQSPPPAWEKRHYLKNFAEWLHVAAEESATYKRERSGEE
jgi:hypothetical protein